MSIRNGDKARTNTQRTKRNAQRSKLRAMRNASTHQEAAPAAKKPSKRSA